MKYKIISLIILVTSLMSCNKSNSDLQNKNIVEIYQLLPVELFDNDGFQFKYQLTEKDGNWTCMSSADYKIPAIVDIKNGFIEIKDEGTGGGSNHVQIALFRDDKKNPTIGIGLGGFNGIYQELNAKFYQFKRKNWIDVTNEVLPEINISEFLNPKYAELHLQKESKIFNLFEYNISLPRHGLTVGISINKDKLKAHVKENVDFKTGEKFSANEIDILWELIGNISIDEIRARWIKSRQMFEITELIPMPFSEIEDILQSGKLAQETLTDEQLILDELWKIPEVLDLANYIDSASNHERSLRLFVEGTPNENNGYYFVRGAEDNGSNWVTHLQLYVNPDNLDIEIYDAVNDKRSTLEEWRKEH